VQKSHVLEYLGLFVSAFAGDGEVERFMAVGS
jgi:hypothetical protein